MTDTLSTYYSQVKNDRLLTKEEETELAKAMDAARWRDDKGKKDVKKLWSEDIDPKTLRKAQKARDKLIQSNLRLVASVAKRYKNRGLLFEDLIQEGNVGLMDGIDRFEWEREFKISTYCMYWIRQRIERLIMNESRTVRVPVHVQTMANSIRSEVEKHIQDNGTKPSREEIMKMADCSEDMAVAILNVFNNNPIVPLDHSPSNQEDNDEMLHAYFEDEDQQTPFDNLSEKELIKTIRDIIKDLPSRDEKIIRLRFGITEDPNDHVNWPITEEEINVLEERASA